MKLALRAANGACRLLDGALRLGGSRFHRHVVRYLWDAVPCDDRDGGVFDIRILAPQAVPPDPGDRPLVERIFAAYRKAKTDQSDAEAVFLPSSIWQGQIDESFRDLVSAHVRGDLDGFHGFLSNFGASRSYTGINHSSLVHECSGTRRGTRRFEEQIMGRMIRWWSRSESRGRDLSALSHPRHGNQAGATVDGRFVGVDSVLNDFYGRMIAGLVRGERPVLAEVGGGYGILAYYISRHLGRFAYVGLDLPETLCCATYYLMKCFPEKKALLYGEGPVDAGALSQFDLVFLPSFEIAGLPDRSVDLALNMSSLGEMGPRTCRRLVSEICRICRGFWHMNHEFRRNRFADGTASLVNSEYPVPPDEFVNVFRYIEPVNAVWKGRFDEGYDIYGYYFERK